MKVALLNSEWFPNAGGGAVHVREIGKRLAENHGCDVDIITKSTCDGEHSSNDSTSLFQMRGTDRQFRVLNEGTYTIRSLSQTISDEYDIVHAHTNVATFPLQGLHYLTDVPTVATIHGSDPDFSVTFSDTALDYLYTGLRHLILKHFTYDRLVSVNEELTEILSKYHEQVVFIPNGVDIDEFPEPGGHADMEFLFVGRLRVRKNPVETVEAMEVVSDAYPAATLHIVGEGPLKPDVEKRVSRCGLEDSVEVHGYVSNRKLLTLYERSSVFILPSEWEGHPLVLLEAWASGLPVIGTDVEGIREFVEAGETGKLVPLNDPDALAEAMGELLAEPEMVRRMGYKSRELVQEEYTWDRTADRTYNMYDEIIRSSE